MRAEHAPRPAAHAHVPTPTHMHRPLRTLRVRRPAAAGRPPLRAPICSSTRRLNHAWASTRRMRTFHPSGRGGLKTRICECATYGCLTRPWEALLRVCLLLALALGSSSSLTPGCAHPRPRRRPPPPRRPPRPRMSRQRQMRTRLPAALAALAAARSAAAARRRRLSSSGDPGKVEQDSGISPRHAVPPTSSGLSVAK